MLLQKRTYTRGVGILYIYHYFTTTPTSHTHIFHPLSTIVIHTLNFAQVKSMDDNCGAWVECMDVASGSTWNLWVWLVGCKEVCRFPHISYPYSSCICFFCSSIPTFCSFFKCCSFFFQSFFVIKFYVLNAQVKSMDDNCGE